MSEAKRLTKEEFLEKYQYAQVKFSSWHKNVFWYSGVIDRATQQTIRIGHKADYSDEIGSAQTDWIADLNIVKADIADIFGRITEYYSE